MGVQSSEKQMSETSTSLMSWETFDEDVSSLGDSSKITGIGLLEQLDLTRDTTDYLWYMTRCVTVIVSATLLMILRERRIEQKY